ncbi:MAG: class I SAM-dependent methyltransferase [Clostridia bacterium]
MFFWQPQMIRFMRDASEFGSFPAKIAQQVASHLPNDAQVCDAGCGLGYLSLALSPLCSHVTAVDISADALAVLTENIRRQACHNIQVVEGEIGVCPPDDPYDAMVFCFFGGISETLLLAKQQCRGKVLMIKKSWERHRFTLSGKPLECFTLADTQQHLLELGIPFQTDTFRVEMGQPFGSIEDAVVFFRIYSRDPDASSITADAIRDKLIHQDSERFPYFLPSKAELGLVVLNTDDIPDFI